jgi:type IV fimbrial biogenesis protein FimT
MNARQAGFTLMELLVTMAILAVLMVVGVPSYRFIMNSYRMSAEVNGLLGDVQFARAEAIKEGQWVSVCVSANGTTCSGTTTWASGWIVFPNNSTNTLTTPAAGTVLRVQNSFTGRVPDTLTPNQAVSMISYNREGFATTGAGFPNTLFTLHESTANSAYTRCLWITPVGLAIVESPQKSISTATCT